MAFTESFPGRSIPTIIETGKIAVGSLSRSFPKETDELRSAFQSNVTTEARLPINVEEDTLLGVTQIVEQRRLSELPIDYRTTYWDPNQKYKHLEVLTTLSQYLDFHDYRLPTSVLPPQRDISEFIEKVKESEKPLTIPQQLNIALDMAGNNIVGAANVAFIATRHEARAFEHRAYPDIKVAPEDITSWNQKVAQFEVYDKKGEMDAPGDTYYFWSHFFGAMAYDALGDIEAQALQKFLSKGTPIMRNVRKYVARHPILTPHEEASVLGRNLGLAVAETVGVANRP